MPHGIPPERAHARHPIEGELTVFRVGELKQPLLRALLDAVELEIDLSGVTEIDTAGVQLLIALKRSAAATDRVLRLQGHAPPVVEALTLLGLAAYFGDPLLEPAQGAFA